MKMLFPNPDLESLFEYTRLHKATTRWVIESVDDVLRSDASEVNTTDSLGRSPLIFAACNDDRKAL